MPEPAVANYDIIIAQVYFPAAMHPAFLIILIELELQEIFTGFGVTTSWVLAATGFKAINRSTKYKRMSVVLT
ncbi:hypothetical protein ABID22_001583 [Pontibacter aydingkolensis]|uniref:Uncharacterized protein n=1 Tax=Pontibacter aydingkolensis TaxID=1911536 RepID=A0ABS7CTT2_9BACT|nr:hypothetical protein [Pontibacter aydingkolensis]MBW7467253.1 hypothetical protein [Pontibacter aydingkolensis]